MEAAAPQRQLRPSAHVGFLLLMFFLPGLFGRWLLLRFTLPLARALDLPHPVISLAILVHVLLLFEVVLLLAAFRWVQGGRSWHRLVRTTRLWPVDWKGMAWAVPCSVAFLALVATWSALVQPRLVALAQQLGFWKEPNIILQINAMPPPEATPAVLLIFLSWALFGAVLEEVYMRGYLQPQMAFLGRFDWVANGLLYGTYHLWVPPLIPTAVVFGLSFALLFKWRQNTWPCVAIKLVFLLLNVLLYLSGMMKAP